MKKIVLCILIVATLISVCSISVLAANSETSQPYYTRFVSVDTYLNMSAAVARYEGHADTNVTSDKVYVTATLQQKINGNWVSIGSASANDNMQVTAYGTCGITSGSFFRVRVDAKVYNSSGVLIESVTVYSSEKYY